jgi:hypothetical protein
MHSWSDRIRYLYDAVKTVFNNLYYFLCRFQILQPFKRLFHKYFYNFI